MLTDVSLEKAFNFLLDKANPLPVVTVPLTDALGHVLANDISIEHNLPSYHKSAVDGYAVSLMDQGKTYLVRENLKPGETPKFSLEPGYAAGVVTGGPVPQETKAVIPQEDVELNGNYIKIKKNIKPSANVILPGEDFQAGELLAQGGTRIDPGIIGVLAAYGKSQVAVLKRPRVAILSLGSGIVPYQQIPAQGQTRNSNGPMLAALAQRDGCQVIDMETISSETFVEVKNCLGKMLHEADLVLTTGGTAFGIYDRAIHLIKEVGAQPLFWGVQIKPGSHVAAGVLKNRFIIALSGNPAACVTGYHLLAAPVLRAFQGLNPYPRYLMAVCTNSFLKKGGSRRFVRGYVFGSQDGWKVTILPGQKSSMLKGIINCNAFIDLPANHQPIEAGTTVSVILIDSPGSTESMHINLGDIG